MRELLNVAPAGKSEPGAHESVINKLISAVYSGPTIQDIESALSATFQPEHSFPSPRLPAPEKSFGKTENKRTLLMKARGIADDGYKWRKYGQKSIKNSPNPRSYYRCTNPRCNAKKQVERSLEDPEMLLVTYEGLHLHYTSHYLLPPPQQCANKPKLRMTSIPAEARDRAMKESPALGPLILPEHKSTHIADDSMQTLLEDVTRASEGLLEDVVPLLVRKPCDPANYPHEYNLSSEEYSLSSSTPTWSPNSSYLDFDILSGIL
ncbi:probable WRKY transcription factor 49 isoform X2 [Zingiber officinale]|uniref:probable WRKY transcription factor 49 isoform X2 n=1 Tax=Zingiber officinale TaxID=94328 RepID=UPI001C4ADE5E|nr:probable WRKY transcription factor 49 isoform X2 [Zingiber officinale]